MTDGDPGVAQQARGRPGLLTRVRPRLRVGLRDRVALGFGALALALSGLLAVVVWLLVSQYLLGQRRANAIEQTALSAASLQRTLATSPSDIPQVLDDAPANDRVASLLWYDGSWYTTSLSAGPSALPSELVTTVQAGMSATQRITVDGEPFLAVGTPLGRSGSAYFELFGLDELDSTYHVLSVTLIVAAAATAVVGVAVGRMASGRVLRPLARLTETASRVARGDLGARLEAEDDPDMGELARSFNHTAEALDRRVVADANFAGDVSHELRTPVMTMLNSVEVLQNHRSELPESLREPLDLLTADLQRFRRLVVDLLEISRDDGTGDQTQLEAVVVADLVRAAARSVTDEDVTVVEPGAEGVRILVDKRRMERVVVDLVENAQVHGGGCVAVSVGLRGAMLQVAVDDAGPGVAPERRERIFARFAREGGSRSGDGVGLGLAIVARHVRWHGGTVSVTDRPGGGARFVVELPVAPA